jgi:hypothetical protein
MGWMGDNKYVQNFGGEICTVQQPLGRRRKWEDISNVSKTKINLRYIHTTPHRESSVLVLERPNSFMN